MCWALVAFGEQWDLVCMRRSRINGVADAVVAKASDIMEELCAG